MAVLIPDEVSWQVQQFRSEHDKGFSRWPAHITLFFPFSFASKDVVATVTNACKQTVPFSVRLAKLARNEGSKYLCLEVEGAEPLQKVREQIGKAMKIEAAKEKWSAHCTVGQASQEEADQVLERLQAEFEPIEFVVSELVILQKDEKGRYKPEAKIKLK